MASPTEPLHRSDPPHSSAAAASDPSPARPPSRRRSKQPATTERRGGAREIVLVGCGLLGPQPWPSALRTLEQQRAIEVRAIVESNPHARERCQREFPRATALGSFEAVVCPPDALVIIASPARFHATQASSALKRGWHVLCVNHFASTAREGASMVSAAERHERLLAMDLPHRFFPAARYLRTLCRDHLLGPLIQFRIHEGTAREPVEGEEPGADKFESPDGVLHDIGLSTLDLLAWCLGPASVKSYADDAMGGVEANAFLELGFNEGVRGTVHLSRDWPTDRSYTFTFERGILRWVSTYPGRLSLHVGSTPFAIEGDLKAPLVPDYPPSPAVSVTTSEQAILTELQHVLGAIAGRESLRIAASEAMPALSLIEECYARRTQLPQPWLSPTEAVQARASAPPTALRRP